MKTILVLASFTQSLINFRGHLLRQFIRRGYRVLACAPQEDQRTIIKLEELGIIFVKINLESTGLNPVKDLFSIIEIVRLLKVTKPDIILAYTIKPVIYGSIAAKIARVPKVFSIITGLGYAFGRESYTQRLLNALSIILYKLAVRINDAIFFQNPDDLLLFQKKGILNENSRAILINGSGVDLDFYKREPYQKKDIAFLFIGRLIKDKGVVEFVEAAKAVKSRYPQIEFRIVGCFHNNPKAIPKLQMEQWTKEGMICFLGETDDVRPFIKNADVFVLPSYREGTPRSTLEAMSMGRAIITTDAPGCKETVIPGYNGLLVPSQNSNALSKAMEEFVLNPDLLTTMGQNSRQLAEEKFDVHKVNRIICETMEV